MSTETLSLRPQTMSAGAVIGTAFWAVIILLAGVGLWLFAGALLALILIFAALFVLIWMRVSVLQGRMGWLALWGHAVVLTGAAGLVSSIILQPGVAQMAQNNGLANLLWGTPLNALLTTILGSLLTMLILATGTTLVVLGLVAYSLRQWNNAEDTPYRDVFQYVFRSYLRPGSWYLTVDGGESKGSERDVKLFETFGGPGWLWIHPGHMVVFHKHGKVTRTEADGLVELGRGERIRAILPLGPQRLDFPIDKVLTRDRIHLNMQVNYTVQIETAPDTRKRLKAAREEARAEYVRLQGIGASPLDVSAAADKYQEAGKALAALAQDKILGEGKDSFYESIAKTVAGKASKVKEALKTNIETELRDVVMTMTSDEMVLLAAGGVQNLADNIGLRRIDEIEKLIQKQVATSSLERGLVLKKFDITNVEYPPEIKGKINEEVGAVIGANIQRIESRTKVESAQADAVAKVVQAKAERSAAAFKAAAKQIMSTEKTDQYKKLVAGLRDSGVPPQTIRDVLVNITSSDAVEVRLNQILELTYRYIQEKASPDS